MNPTKIDIEPQYHLVTAHFPYLNGVIRIIWFCRVSLRMGMDSLIEPDVSRA